MLPYTPVPTPLPSTINQPQDVIDNVVVDTVNPQDQILADASAWLTLVNNQCANFLVVAGSYTAGDPVVVTGVGGYVPSDFTNSPPGKINLDVIHPGVAIAIFQARIRSSTGGADLNASVDIKLDATAGGGSLSTVGIARGLRSSSSTGAPIDVIGIAGPFQLLHDTDIIYATGESDFDYDSGYLAIVRLA